ncbi:hypothetical protein [Microbacterium elymi]|uniref:hypothetical protein n=1 Tax=Microbacterium elymi TaxID=2909587 RepID=UPI00338D639B
MGRPRSHRVARHHDDEVRPHRRARRRRVRPGQHDATEDVLGSDVRGILVRADAWRELEGLDPALVGADEGLDLGVRTRLAGGRVVVVPAARVAVYGDGVAGLPAFPRAHVPHLVHAPPRAGASAPGLCAPGGAAVPLAGDPADRAVARGGPAGRQDARADPARMGGGTGRVGQSGRRPPRACPHRPRTSGRVEPAGTAAREPRRAAQLACTRSRRERDRCASRRSALLLRRRRLDRARGAAGLDRGVPVAAGVAGAGRRRARAAALHRAAPVVGCRLRACARPGWTRSPPPTRSRP